MLRTVIVVGDPGHADGFLRYTDLTQAQPVELPEPDPTDVALFLARPCPFYLLDEVEAALDDTNIGRFVELLRRYSDRTQFIVITHQKRTMEAADILYGVTMGADGVSQIVSRRLPREQAVAVAS